MVEDKIGKMFRVYVEDFELRRVVMMRTIIIFLYFTILLATDTFARSMPTPCPSSGCGPTSTIIMGLIVIAVLFLFVRSLWSRFAEGNKNEGGEAWVSFYLLVFFGSLFAFDTLLWVFIWAGVGVAHILFALRDEL